MSFKDGITPCSLYILSKIAFETSSELSSSVSNSIVFCNEGIISVSSLNLDISDFATSLEYLASFKTPIALSKAGTNFCSSLILFITFLEVSSEFSTSVNSSNAFCKFFKYSFLYDFLTPIAIAYSKFGID